MSFLARLFGRENSYTFSQETIDSNMGANDKLGRQCYSAHTQYVAKEKQQFETEKKSKSRDFQQLYGKDILKSCRKYGKCEFTFYDSHYDFGMKDVKDRLRAQDEAQLMSDFIDWAKKEGFNVSTTTGQNLHLHKNRVYTIVTLEPKGLPNFELV